MDQVAEELWQAYDNQGEPLAGDGLTKAQARSGVLHGAAHVWMWHKQSDNITILLQKRALTKATWPGRLDVSAAGHIDLDETPLRAAIRETKEELGLDISATALRLLFVHRQFIHVDQSAVIENEFQWVYGLEVEHESEMTVQQHEVEATLWLDMAAFQTAIHTNQMVPHGEVYFSSLMREINQSYES